MVRDRHEAAADLGVLAHRAAAVLQRQRVPLALLHERVDDEVGRAARDHPAVLALLLEVLGGARGREVGVRRLEPAGERRRVQVGLELAQILEAVGELPEHEVGLRAHSDEAVGAELHTLGPLLDDLGVGVLGGRALLDREAPPGRVEPVERVGDVLLSAGVLGHVENRSRRDSHPAHPCAFRVGSWPSLKRAVGGACRRAGGRLRPHPPYSSRSCSSSAIMLLTATAIRCSAGSGDSS